jgi:hypothetical protein
MSFDPIPALISLFFGLLIGTPLLIYITCKIINKWVNRIPQNHRMPSSEEMREQRLKEVWSKRRS